MHPTQRRQQVSLAGTRINSFQTWLSCPQEIVMYAYFNKLDYFSTECVYAPFAARGAAREFVKDLEASGSSTGSQAR